LSPVTDHMGMRRDIVNMMSVGKGYLLDALWPPACPISGELVDISGHLNAETWQSLEFLDAPWCEICGMPFEHSAGRNVEIGKLCGPCIGKTPRFDSARAPLVYDENSRPLVIGFKNGSRQEMLDQFAKWMVRVGRKQLDHADIIMPVPLHWRRLISRRYNQSALLGLAISKQTGIPFEAGCLLRKRATPSQAGRSVKDRRRNMAGAFIIRDEGNIKGRNIVLIDDVFTTGATVSACTRLLKRAGAKQVHIITLCRVVRTSDPTM
jgi:ComF family protein